MPPTRWTGLSVASLRVRWADGPDDAPAEGEALGRLQRIPRSSVPETIEGGGAEAAGLRIDVTTGEVSRTESRRTDLVVSRSRYEIVLSTADGRRLVARFGNDVASPQADSDAPGDLRDALNRLWSASPPIGRPPAITSIIEDEQLREPIREMRRGRVKTTQQNVAARSGFTLAEIRGYLRVTRRSWTDFLRSF